MAPERSGRLGAPKGCPSIGRSCHSPPASDRRGVPPKKLGSGLRIEPSVPCSSIGGRVCRQMSQEAVKATLAPLAKASTPLTVVETSTSITWPFSGSLVTVRVGLPREASALTLATGPSTLRSWVIG